MNEENPLIQFMETKDRFYEEKLKRHPVIYLIVITIFIIIVFLVLLAKFFHTDKNSGNIPKVNIQKTQEEKISVNPTVTIAPTPRETIKNKSGNKLYSNISENLIKLFNE